MNSKEKRSRLSGPMTILIVSLAILSCLGMFIVVKHNNNKPKGNLCMYLEGEVAEQCKKTYKEFDYRLTTYSKSKPTNVCYNLVNLYNSYKKLPVPSPGMNGFYGYLYDGITISVLGSLLEYKDDCKLEIDLGIVEYKILPKPYVKPSRDNEAEEKLKSDWVI